MNTYNFFYLEYVDGVAVEKAFYSVDAVVPAQETAEYKVLSQLLRRGIVTSFGWTTITPYQVN